MSDPSAQNADLVRPNREPFEGTCDCCAEGEKQIVHVDPDTEAYVCDECMALERLAIKAAAEAMSLRPVALMVADGWSYTWDDLAEIAVNAYLRAKWQAEQSDGSESAR